MSRHNRQNRHNGRYLRAKCGQHYNEWPGIDLCGISPNSFITSPAIVQQAAAQLPGNPLTVGGGYSEKNLRRMVQFAEPSQGSARRQAAEARQETLALSKGVRSGLY
jgi:hypothetical protein